MSSNLLNIRMLIDHLKITKMIQFESFIPIKDVIAQIQAKVPDSLKPNTKPEDYSIFKQNIDDEKYGFWLSQNATLNDYSIKQGDELIYRDMNRLLRFKLPDESLKTVIVNETKVVGEILKIICARAGVVNIDEYSLAIEAIIHDDKFGTLSLSKKDTISGTSKKKGSSIGLPLKKIEEREKKKMEKMKNKLHTDDDTRWVEHDKTLAEQGIDATCILVLKRKYFYESNRNVLDPFELNILFKQCEESVLTGTLMINEEEAIKLSALSIQIHKGNLDEATYKNTDFKNYLPAEYSKISKSLDKKIKEEYRKLENVPESECKQRYTVVCQSSKLYGVSIFLVKEKIPGKQKLGPILLGITKESVTRMDEKSKETLKVWPLTCIRRWAASANSFTFDFGEYDENYSIMTSESDQISKLISGYIDLILKKKRAQAAELINSGVALVEENIQPGQGVFVSSGVAGDSAKSKGVHGRAQMSEKTGGIKAGYNNQGLSCMSKIYGKGKVNRTKVSQPQKFSSSQKAFIFKLNQLKESIPDEEIIPASIDDINIGNAKSLESYKYFQKQILYANLNSMAVSLTNTMNNVQDKDNLDYNGLNYNTSELNENFEKLLLACIDYSAFCTEDERSDLDKLLKEYAKNLKQIFDSFVIVDDNVKEIDKKSFMNSYNATSKNLNDLIKFFGLESLSDEQIELIVGRGKNLSVLSSKLIAEANKISNECTQKEVKDKIDLNVSDFKNNLTQIMTSLTMLAPMLRNEQTYQYFVENLENLQKKITLLQNSCEENKSYPDFANLRKSADEVRKALDSLLNEAKNSQDKNKSETKRLLFSIALLINESIQDTDDIDEIKTRSKDLTLNLGKLLAVLKNDLNAETDDQLKNDLYMAAKSLAEATKHLLENTKNFQNEDYDAEVLRLNHNEIVTSIQDILSKKFSNEFDEAQALAFKKHIDRLVGSVIVMDSAMKNATESCRSENLENALFDNSEELRMYLQDLTDALMELLNNPDSEFCKEDLILRTSELCVVSKRAVQISKNASPLISDFDQSTNLNKASKNLTDAVEDVEKLISQRKSLNDEMKAHYAMQRINHTLKSLENVKTKFEEGKMEKFLPENKEMYDTRLVNLYREIMKIQSQLADPSNIDNNSNIAEELEKLSLLYCRLLNPLYGSLACSQDEKNINESKTLINNISNVMNCTLKCCNLAEYMFENEEKAIPDDLFNALKCSSDAMLKLFENLPTNQDIENAIKTIENIRNSYEAKQPGLPLPPGMTFVDQQKEISKSISQILGNVAELLRTTYRDDVQKFPPLFTAYSDNYALMYRQVKSLLTRANDKNTYQLIDETLGSVVKSCNRLASTAKLYTSDPHQSSKIFFSEAAKNFSDDLSNMLLKIVSSKPGRRECENYKNLLKFTYRPLIESSDREIIPEKNYLSSVEDINNSLTKKFKNIEKTLKSGIESEKSISNISDCVNELGNFIVELLKNAAQASYLIGMTDSSSISARANIFDENDINQNIDSLKILLNSIPLTLKEIQKSDIENISKELVKFSTNIMNCCKKAVNSLTGNPNIQKELLEIANALTSSTKDSVTFLKELENSQTDAELNDKVKKCSQNILSEIDKLLKLIDGQDIKSIPGKIGDRGRLMQEPVVIEALGVTDSFATMFELLSSLIDCFDQHTKEEVDKISALNNKNISNLILKLESNAPGEELYVELLHRLEEINLDILKRKDETLSSSLPDISSSKEHEARLEMLTSKMISVLQEISRLPEKMVHLRVGKFECVVDLFENVPEIIKILCKIFPNIDKVEKMKLFEIMSNINYELSHAINASRVKPEKIHGENPKKFTLCIDNSIKQTEKLKILIDEIVQKSNVIQAIINDLNQSIQKFLKNTRISISNISQNEEEKLIMDCLKAILKDSQDLASKVGETNEEICSHVLKEYEKCGMALFSEAPHKKNKEYDNIKSNFIDLGNLISGLLEKIRQVEVSGSDSDKKSEVNQQVKKISQKISEMFKNINSLHKGVESCVKLSDLIQEHLNEIETCILFAENKSLEKDPDSPNFISLKDQIKNFANEITQNLNELKKNKEFNDSVILNFSTSINDKSKKLLHNSAKAAVSLGVNESDNQILLLDAAKNVGNSLEDLLKDLKNNSNNNNIQDDIDKTKSSVHDYVNVLDKLADVVSSSSETLSQTISKIEIIKNYLNLNVPCSYDNETCNLKPEDCVRISKDIPISCVKLVQATGSGKTKDMQDSVKLGEEVFEQLIKAVRKFALVSNDETMKKVNASLKSSIESYLTLLKEIKSNPSSVDTKKLSELSKVTTQDVFDFVKKCSDLKAEQFNDINDPQLLAERELLNAAASIEMAAKKLAELKPRPVENQPNKDLNFDGQILQAVQSIMKATSLLVTHATSAQKELVAKGVLQVKKEGDTGQWSQGLISAARMVSESTLFLCDEAQAAVEGRGSEEKLIAACNSIFASTSQLIMACKVKADPNSENQARLEKAGLAVKKASKGLVESLKGSGLFAGKNEEVEVDSSHVGGMKQVLNALEEVAKKEKELNEAREKLFKLRQAKPQQ